MKYKKPDWQKIKQFYITSNEGLREVAKEFGVPETTAFHRMKIEGWTKLRKEFRSKVDAELTHSAINQRVQQVTEMNTRHITIWKNLQAICHDVIIKYVKSPKTKLQRLKNKEIVRMLVALSVVLTRATEGERVALGQATEITSQGGNALEEIINDAYSLPEDTRRDLLKAVREAYREGKPELGGKGTMDKLES